MHLLRASRRVASRSGRICSSRCSRSIDSASAGLLLPFLSLAALTLFGVSVAADGDLLETDTLLGRAAEKHGKALR